MNISKFNDFVSSLGYSLPNGFNYSMNVGELIRFKNSNKAKNNKDIWIKRVSYSTYVIGDWATGQSHIYRDDTECTHDNYIKTQEEIERKQYEEVQRQVKKAKKLEKYFSTLPRADINHPYLVNKDVYHDDIRQDKDLLIIPGYGMQAPFIGEFQTIQKITSTGFKQFEKGASSKAIAFGVSTASTDRFMLVEGFATGCSVFEIIQAKNIEASVICVFNCNNLMPVAQRLRKIYPQSIIEIWGDKDKSGVGQSKASEVAAEFNCIVKLPPLTDEQVESGLSDWNDYLNYTKRGL